MITMVVLIIDATRLCCLLKSLLLLLPLSYGRPQRISNHNFERYPLGHSPSQQLLPQWIIGLMTLQKAPLRTVTVGGNDP